MVLGDLDSYMQKNETWWPSYTINQNKLKIKDLYISPDTMKVLYENIGRKISDSPCSNIFTNMSPRARDGKKRVNKWDLIKLKSFCMAQENSIKMEREPTVWETYLPMILQKRAWYPKYIKNSPDSAPGGQTTQLKNGERTWTDTSPRKTYRGPRDIWKDAQHH